MCSTGDLLVSVPLFRLFLGRGLRPAPCKPLAVSLPLCISPTNFSSRWKTGTTAFIKVLDHKETKNMEVTSPEPQSRMLQLCTGMLSNASLSGCCQSCRTKVFNGDNLSSTDNWTHKGFIQWCCSSFASLHCDVIILPNTSHLCPYSQQMWFKWFKLKQKERCITMDGRVWCTERIRCGTGTAEALRKFRAKEKKNSTMIPYRWCHPCVSRAQQCDLHLQGYWRGG